MNRKTSGKYGHTIDLRAMEEEVLAEGQAWMQRRMEEKLREEAAAFSPGGRKNAQDGSAPEADA